MKRREILLLGLTFVTVAAVAPHRARAQGGPLLLHQPVEAHLAKGARHTHGLSLPAGHYAHIVIEQPRLNLQMRVRGSDGSDITGLGGADLQMRGRPDRIVLVAKSDIDYVIELAERDGVAGDYSIAMVQQGAVTPVEQARFDAQSLLAGAITVAATRSWTTERRAQLEHSLAISGRIGDAKGQLDAALSLGMSYLLGDRRRAVPHFSAAVAIAQRAGDLRSEAEALNNLGETATAIGEPRRAADYLLRAIEVGRKIDPVNRDELLTHNLAAAYRDAGEYQKALQYGHQVLSAWSAIGEPDAEAYAANSVGMTHFLLGDSDAALQYFAVAHDRWSSTGQTNGAAMALTSRGTALAAGGDHVAAIEEFRRASAILVGSGVRADAAVHGRTNARLAASLASLGRWVDAGAAYERALPFARQAGAKTQEADILRGLGEVRHAGGDPAAAQDFYRQALAIERAAEHRSGEAATLLAMARLARDGQRWGEARARIEGALELIESLRTTVSSPDLRASFLASKRDYYDFYIDLLMQMHRREPAAGHEVAALLVSERSRARSLIEMLTEAGADIRAGAPTAVHELERAAQQELTSKAARLTRVLSATHTDEQAAAAREDLRAAVTAYEGAQARVRAESPRYAALAYPAPLDLAAIRGRVLDRDTALVEYSLGRERSYVWIVTRDGVVTQQLPARAVIEAAAREAHERLAAGNRRETWGQAARAAERLSDLILPPAIGAVAQRRLLIVADGALNYIPFAALSRPGAVRTPLIVAYEIVSLPSASVLAAIRLEASGRAPAPNRVAVLADPVLDASDTRVRNVHGATPLAAGGHDLLRSAAESGIPHFTRLAFTRDEADAIASVAGRARSMFSLDFDASRATATGGALANYRIVHLATHGLVNSDHPQLSGLVMSLVDSRGAPQDGFVRLHDIYNMKLNADLVVLSACRTALGKNIRGEGVVGLTRGFMHAGAARVVASLWDVRDRATAELMKRFYERMLTGGLSPAAALRDAQLSMWNEPRWQAPFNWAGFIIQGEWHDLP